jgi:TonB family protein
MTSGGDTLASRLAPELMRNWHASCTIPKDMFGLPDEDSSQPEERERHKTARFALLKLLETDDEEAPWPQGNDRSVVFLLDERVSPRPVRLRDRPMLIALLISMLFHLTLLWELRGNSLLQGILASGKLAAKVNPDDNTPFFEMVEMPKQKQERPSQSKAPASDLDRRAHGGVGAPALTPGSHGNTPEMRLEPPLILRAEKPARQQQEDREAARDTGKGGKDSGEGEKAKVTGAGADAVLLVPKEGGGEKQEKGLRGLSTFGALGLDRGASPDRRGGQVDLGPLSFDTQWYDWGPYAAEMLRRIRYHWDIPEVAQLGVPGVVRIHFFIERDGHVTGLEIQRESGHPPLDFSARDAILDASPLPPLPADLAGVFHEGVTITFYYNTPVPERTQQG